MHSRRRASLCSAAAVVTAAALTSCASSDATTLSHPPRATAVGTVPATRLSGPRIRIHVSRPCPQRPGDEVDVTNSFPGRAASLLPTDAHPTAGLVCAYSSTSPGRGASVLQRTIHLNGDRAGQLARVVDRVSLRPAHGAFSCPAEFAGAHTLIALRYARYGDVDLWYATSGCQTLDNGMALAFQGANPSFGGFQTTFDKL